MFSNYFVAFADIIFSPHRAQVGVVQALPYLFWITMIKTIDSLDVVNVPPRQGIVIPIHALGKLSFYVMLVVFWCASK